MNKGGLDDYKLKFEELHDVPSYELLRKARLLAKRGTSRLKSRLHGAVSGKSVRRVGGKDK